MRLMLTSRRKIAAGIALVVILFAGLGYLLMHNGESGLIIWQAQLCEEGYILERIEGVCFLSPEKVALLTCRGQWPSETYTVRTFDQYGQELDRVVVNEEYPRTSLMTVEGAAPGSRELLALVHYAYVDDQRRYMTLIVDFATNHSVSLSDALAIRRAGDQGSPFSPSGDLILAVHRPAGSPSEVQLYDSVTGELVESIVPFRNPSGSRTPYDWQAFWRDSNSIAWRDDRTVYMYDLEERKVSTLYELDLPDITDYTIELLSPDGSRVAVYDSKLTDTLEVLVYDCVDSRLVSTIRQNLTQEQMISQVSWSPDGERIAVVVGPPAISETPSYVIYLGSVATGSVSRIHRPGWRVELLAWSPDSRRLAATGYPEDPGARLRAVISHEIE